MLLWGLDNRRVDLAMTALAAILLLVSRFALLASGPWEWDETIFARGMLHFELAGHFPQPPGFPGLLALGHLLLPLADTPFRALQYLSALTSILALWPLAALGRKVAPAPVAALSALLILFLPGPWLFSVRGFSTIPATFFLVAAAALWAAGFARPGIRITLFTLALTVAFLVRPVLLPTVGLLWLGGISRVKPLRRILPGMLLGTTLIAAAVGVMVHLEGGWSAFLEPFFRHATSHGYRLDWNTGSLSNYGLIKGLGGLPATAVALVVVTIGLGVWKRRVGGRAAAAWLCILALTATQLIMLQNRSYARYSVVVQTGLAPLVAGAAGLAPTPIAVVTLLTAVGLAVHRTLPLLSEQHSEYFGAWKVTVDAAAFAEKRGWAVIVEPEVYPFASYWWHVLKRRGDSVPPMILSPRAPEAWQGVDRPWVVATVHPHLYLPSLVGREVCFGCVSPAVKPMTQDRFLSAAISENPPLPVGQWWSRESLPNGKTFMWAGAQAQMWLPPLPPGTRIGIELKPAVGKEPVRVSLHGHRYDLDGFAEASWVWFETENSQHGPTVIRLSRARGFPPGGGDQRALSVQVRNIIIRPPGTAFAGPVADIGDRAALRLEISAAYGAEIFFGRREGLWLQPESGLRIALDEPGRLGLEISAPRPTKPQTTIRINGRTVVEHVDFGAKPTLIKIAVGDESIINGLLELEVESVPFVPSESGESSDSRRLGVVLHAIEFEPAKPAAQGWWSRGQHQAGW